MAIQNPIFVKLVAGLFNAPERFARGRVVCSFREDELEIVSISEEEVRDDNGDQSPDEEAKTCEI